MWVIATSLSACSKDDVSTSGYWSSTPVVTFDWQGATLYQCSKVTLGLDGTIIKL